MKLLGTLQESAQAGEAMAQYQLGLRYEYGRGLRRDDTTAVKHWREAYRYWYRS